MRELLLRRILARIKDLPQPLAGRIASAAAAEQKDGRLLSLACDAWDIPLSRVAERADVAQVDVSKFVAGMWEPGERDVQRICAAIVCTMAGDGH